jgi:DNA-binding response OmpR family regulator
MNKNFSIINNILQPWRAYTLVSTIIVIDDEQIICEVIGDYFRDGFGMEVDCAHTASEGADMLLQKCYDLALIDATLPGLSGLDLAAVAVNANTPVLLTSGHPEANFKLHQFGYPYLAKPFSLVALRSEAARVIREGRENIERVKASTARMKATAQTLKAAMARSDRLLDTIRVQQMLGRWGIAGPSTSER